jgi:hypothetical protein
LIDFQKMKSNADKLNYKKEILWLNFLVSLSFTSDGQNFFMKVESLFTTVIKLLDTFNGMTSISLNTQTEIQYLSLLILRNLSFSPSNKSKLVSQCEFFKVVYIFIYVLTFFLLKFQTAEYINVIIQMLKSRNENFHLLAISTIDSLLFKYQKVENMIF